MTKLCVNGIDGRYKSIFKDINAICSKRYDDFQASIVTENSIILPCEIHQVFLSLRLV
jgi:hypothetical protein